MSWFPKSTTELKKYVVVEPGIGYGEDDIFLVNVSFDTLPEAKEYCKHSNAIIAKGVE